MKKRIYLDNNASTPLDPRVAEAVVQELSFGVSNPSSPHQLGQAARGRLDKARRAVASFFKVKPQEVIFTSSGTESMNFLIQGALRTCKGEVITSDSEHSCVYQLLKDRPETIFLKGVPTLEAVKAAATDKTALIILMAVNNETGVKTDINLIAHFANEKGIPFIVDGVAWLGKEVVELPSGVSGIGFSGHKIHAPAGIGCALFRSTLKMSPLIVGGAQERGLRGGTENMVGIAAFARALELLSQESYDYILSLRERFEEGLLRKIPHALIQGRDYARISNVSNILFPGTDGETFLMNLDQAGVLSSLGSACTSGALEPSRTLLSMGLSYKEAKSSLRFSFSRLNTPEEIDQALEIIHSVYERGLS